MILRPFGPRRVTAMLRAGGETVQVTKTKWETSDANTARRKAHDRLDHVLDLIAGKKEITATEKSAQEWDQFKEKNKHVFHIFYNSAKFFSISLSLKFIFDRTRK